MPGVYISELAGIQCSIEHTPTVEKIEALHLKSGYMSQIHQHPDAAELMFIDRGAGSVRVREENYPVHEGGLVVYNAGEFHREVFLRSGDPPCVYALRLQKLRIYGSRDGELLSDGLPPVFHTHAYRGLILQGMQTILEAVGKEGDYFQRVTERVASAMVLLVMLLSNDENAVYESASEKTPFEQIKAFIERNYTQQISIRRMADALHVNYYYMSHLFKEKMGISMKTYIIQCRIWEAAMLLRETDLPIQEIGRRVGYSNQSHFNVQFRSINGATPLAYRKAYMEDKRSRSAADEEIRTWRDGISSR